MKRIIVKDSEALHSFGYDPELRTLVVWFKNKKGNHVPKPYIYVGVGERIFERMKTMNLSYRQKEILESRGRAVPSLGTYVNTKLKKYPTLDVRGTIINDGITAARRISKDVKTQSDRSTVN